MIADDRSGPFETAVKMISAPVWVPIYFAGVRIWKLGQALKRRKSTPVQQVEVLQSVPTWMPRTQVERAVFAALVLAGDEPVTNARLAALMGVSPGEASRRVAQLEGAIRKARKGREVLISLH